MNPRGDIRPQAGATDDDVLLQQALALHKAGRLAEARDIYDGILARNPDQFDTLQLRGTLACQAGQFDEAERLFVRAIAIKPDFAAVHANRALALRRLGRLEEAVTSLSRAVALKPDYAEAHSNRGFVLHELGRLDGARASFDKAIALKPGHAEACFGRGNTLRDLGRLAEAAADYDRAIASRPDYADAHSARGVALQELGCLEEAVASFDKAINLNPLAVEAHYSRGIALRQLGRLAEAVASYDRAIALNPEHADASYNRGNALHEMGRFAEAIESYGRVIALRPGFAEACTNRGVAHQDAGNLDAALADFDRAIALKPGFADAYLNRGAVLRELGRCEEAIAGFDKAIALKSDFADAYSNRGIALQELKRLDQAAASHDKAMALDPASSEIRWNRSLFLLLTGRFEEGWRLYEARKTKKAPKGNRSCDRPAWLGETGLDGKTILVHSEQGLGDTIQFCRYVKCLAGRGAKVLFEPHPALGRLCASLGAEIVRQGATPPEFDCHAALLSLPLAFGTDIGTVPHETPYLSAEAGRVASWRARLGGYGCKVGICWQGNRINKVDRGRSFPVTLFEQLSRMDGVRLISLQKGDGEEQLQRLPEGMAVETLGGLDAGSDAFLDTAAVMESLDLIVTSDTAVAHLAGALARPVWVALKQVPDWRWMLDRADSPWYPTMRLFRQKHDGDWAGVFEDIRRALLERLEQARR